MQRKTIIRKVEKFKFSLLSFSIIIDPSSDVYERLIFPNAISFMPTYS